MNGAPEATDSVEKVDDILAEDFLDVELIAVEGESAEAAFETDNPSTKAVEGWVQTVFLPWLK
jgi:hypothetical protein